MTMTMPTTDTPSLFTKRYRSGQVQLQQYMYRSSSPLSCQSVYIMHGMCTQWDANGRILFQGDYHHNELKHLYVGYSSRVYPSGCMLTTHPSGPVLTRHSENSLCT